MAPLASGCGTSETDVYHNKSTTLFGGTVKARCKNYIKNNNGKKKKKHHYLFELKQQTSSVLQEKNESTQRIRQLEHFIVNCSVIKGSLWIVTLWLRKLKYIYIYKKRGSNTFEVWEWGSIGEEAKDGISVRRGKGRTITSFCCRLLALCQQTRLIPTTSVNTRKHKVRRLNRKNPFQNAPLAQQTFGLYHYKFAFFSAVYWAASSPHNIMQYSVYSM